MPKTFKDALDIDLHPAAMSTALNRINEFTVMLILEAKRIAFQNKADVVLSTHIEESLEVINSRRKENLAKQVAQIIGGAFFGAFIQGFVSEISATPP